MKVVTSLEAAELSVGPRPRLNSRPAFCVPCVIVRVHENGRVSVQLTLLQIPLSWLERNVCDVWLPPALAPPAIAPDGSFAHTIASLRSSPRSRSVLQSRLSRDRVPMSWRTSALVRGRPSVVRDFQLH